MTHFIQNLSYTLNNCSLNLLFTSASKQCFKPEGHIVCAHLCSMCGLDMECGSKSKEKPLFMMFDADTQNVKPNFDQGQISRP